MPQNRHLRAPVSLLTCFQADARLCFRVSGCVDLKLSMFACTYASAYYVMYLAVMSLDMLSDEMSSSSLEMSASSSSKDSIADNEVRRVVLGIYHQCLSQLF